MRIGTMAILPTPTVDYTDFDFDSLRARAYSLISAAFPDWTDESVASFGNLLVELFCNVGDVLGFYLDNRARESRISQATQRSSVVALAKLLGYTPSGATPATTTLTFTLAEVPANDVVIAAGRPVSTRAVTDPVTFQTTAVCTILAGANPPVGTAPAEHSASHSATYASTGLPNQEITLANTPYLDVGTTVSAANGAYTKVSNFLSSGASDRHYTITVDSNDRAKIRFGNGTNGQLPSGTITVNYKTGGGTDGNLEPNTLTKLTGSFTDVLGNPVVVGVTNLVEASGGAPRESRAQTQANAPESLRALTRTVAREDYEINAKRVAGVQRALMLTSNELAAIGENRGRLYIIPAGGGNPSSQMKTDVLTMVTVTYPNTLTFHVDVLNPVYLTVNVQATVFPRKGTNLTTLDAAIRRALVDYFALTTDAGTEDEADNPNVNFGYYASQDSTGSFDGTIALSDIFNVVRDVEGVRKIGDGNNDFLLNGYRRDVTIAVNEFPRLGQVILLNGETGTPLV